MLNRLQKHPYISIIWFESLQIEYIYMIIRIITLIVWRFPSKPKPPTPNSPKTSIRSCSPTALKKINLSLLAIIHTLIKLNKFDIWNDSKNYLKENTFKSKRKKRVRSKGPNFNTLINLRECLFLKGNPNFLKIDLGKSKVGSRKSKVLSITILFKAKV